MRERGVEGGRAVGGGGLGAEAGARAVGRGPEARVCASAEKERLIDRSGVRGWMDQIERAARRTSGNRSMGVDDGLGPQVK